MTDQDARDRSPFDLEKNRIESLSDGLFAVAMTLLVLSVKLPVVPTGAKAQNVDLVPFLGELGRSLLVYAIAFVQLGVYWVLHHLVYHAVRAADRVLLWLTIFFFLFVSVLPLSVQFVNQYSEAQVTYVIFGANLAAVGWMLYIQWAYICRHPGLTDSRKLSLAFRNSVGPRVLLVPIVATATSLICFWSTAISGWVYVGMLPFYLVPSDAWWRKPQLERPGDAEPPVRRVRGGRIAWPGFIAVTAVAWAAFRPETLFLNRRTFDPPVTSLGFRETDVVATGTFKGVAHQTMGRVTAYRSPTGRTLIRLEGVSTSNGPDVHILLVAAAEVRDNEAVRRSGYVDLGSMKGNIGNQNYDVPSDCDLTKFRNVTIWCDRFKVNFASAPLSLRSP